MTLTDKKTLPGSPKGKIKGQFIDVPFLFAVMILLAVGLMMLYSAGFAISLRKTGDSYTYIRKQLFASVVGIAAMLAVILFPLPKKLKFNKLLKAVTPIGYAVSFVLLVILLFTHNDTEKRWLYVLGFQFQPSDIMKVFLVMACAMIMSRESDEKDRLVFRLTWKWKNRPVALLRFFDKHILPLAIVGFPVLLVVLEPHLSGAALLFIVGMFVLLAGGLNPIIELLTFGGAFGAGVLIASTNTYMAKRLFSFQHPFDDILGDGLQAYQSLVTIGSGGLFGLGYGESRQKYLFLPEAHNDFIFSIVAEELGFVGVCLIILLFGFLVWRGIYISLHIEDKFSSLVVFGLTCKVAVQVLLNFIVVSCIGPTTGIALPFFSYGGTAMAVLLGEMGIILRLSREAYIK